MLTTPIDDDAKPVAAKYLTKWRPGFADRLKSPEDEEKKAHGNGNGIAAV